MAVRLKISDFYKSDFEKRANTIRKRGAGVGRITGVVHISEGSRTLHTTVFQPIPFKFIVPKCNSVSSLFHRLELFYIIRFSLAIFIKL